MNKINEIKSLIKENDKAIIMVDGEIIYSNIDITIKDSSISLDNEDLKVFYILTKDLNLNYNLYNDTTLTEVFYEVANSVNLNQNYYIDKNANINLIEVLKNGFTRNTQTNISGNAYLKVDNLYITDKKAKVDTMFDILESNANVEVNNVIIALCDCVSDFNLNTKHNKALSTSQMITYAVSKDGSVLNVNTNGIILKGASKTNLNQKTKGIILDEKSQISANPILEIDEYDVIASHGASVGAIDDEEVYYLMSRGLRKEESERLIIGGLIYPFLNSVKSSSVKEYVSSLINEAL